MDRQKINRAIDRGIAYLAKQQLPNGGFTSFSSARRLPFRPDFRYHTTFVPSLMKDHVATGLAALSQVPYLRPNNILTKLLGNMDATINQTVKTQAEAQTFLKAYKHTATKR